MKLSKKEIIEKVNSIMGENGLRSSYFVGETKLVFRQNYTHEVYIFIDVHTGESRMGGRTSEEFKNEILEIMSSKEIAPSTGWYADSLR